MLNLFFHVINGGMIAAALWYLFRRFAQARLQQSITLEQLHLVNLTNRQDQSYKQERSLMRAAHHQQQLYGELSEKIKRWHEVIRLKKEQVAQERELIDQARATAAQERHISLERQAFCQQVLPPVIEQAKQELIQWYSQEAHARKYLEGILSPPKDSV